MALQLRSSNTEPLIRLNVESRGLPTWSPRRWTRSWASWMADPPRSLVEQETDLELARRASTGALLYCVAAAVGVIFTDYARRQPLLALGFCIILLALGLHRFWLSRTMLKNYARSLPSGASTSRTHAGLAGVWEASSRSLTCSSPWNGRRSCCP